MTNTKTTRLLLSDLTDVCRIESEAHGIHYWTRQNFLDELNNPCSEYWILEKKPEGLTIGFTGMHVIQDQGFIMNLAVDKSFQGQGFGKKLLEHLIEESKKLELSSLSLEVRESNQKAIGLYKKYGFKIVGERKSYYPPKESSSSERENGLIMSCFL